MTELAVPAYEHGIVRVFAISGDVGGRADWLAEDDRARARIEAALGAGALDHAYTEVIETEAVKALGLSTYLVDGMGLPEQAVAPDTARLNALSGLVLIVTSRAFGGREATLALGPELTLIGKYSEPAPSPSFNVLTSESARGRVAGTTDSARPVVPSRQRGFPSILILVIAIVLGLIMLEVI